jgi:hypothetical protein
MLARAPAQSQGSRTFAERFRANQDRTVTARSAPRSRNNSVRPLNAGVSSRETSRCQPGGFHNSSATIGTMKDIQLNSTCEVYCWSSKTTPPERLETTLRQRQTVSFLSDGTAKLDPVKVPKLDSD